MSLTAPAFDTPFEAPFNPALDLQLVREIPISPEQAFDGWTVPATLMLSLEVKFMQPIDLFKFIRG